jgi:hypothetical protein
MSILVANGILAVADYRLSFAVTASPMVAKPAQCRFLTFQLMRFSGSSHFSAADPIGH